MMNDLKNDPSGGTLWWAKEADPRQNKYKSFLNLTTGAPYRRPRQRYLMSAVYSGLIKMSQYIYFFKIKAGIRGPNSFDETVGKQFWKRKKKKKMVLFTRLPISAWA